MATYGLRIINDDSELLIDSEYFSPAFAQKLEFSPTVYSEEAGSTYFHSGYVKREYRTSTVTAPGNFIVMWTLPDTTEDVWYNFETSTTSMGGYLTLWVYANSLGANLTYTLPTGYLFAISSLPAASETYGLRLFNAAGTKTFDSNNVQLAPYSISDSFTFFDDPTGAQGLPTSISLAMPTNPIFMLPNYTALRILKRPTTHLEFVYEAMFRRQGTSVQTKEVQVYYSDEDSAWPYTQTIYNSGNRQGLGIIVADADLYAAPGTGTGTGTNPQYQLASTSTSTTEGATVTVTLTTQNVANESPFAYTVTGISTEDLTAGGLTGTFVIYNNSATATFTFANDYYTDGTEVFKLSLDGMSQFINITVEDTSVTPSYSWSTPGAVNEGATGFTTFNATGANGKTVLFSVIGPSAGLVSISGSSDGALLTGSWVVSGNAATSINVQYSAVADTATEGPEAFRLIATVDGIQVGGTSGDIIVNDTSKAAGYSLAAADNWNESNTYPVTVSANNVNGSTLYLTTDNALVTPSSSTVSVTSDSFTSNVSFTAGIATANTTVRISLRTGSTSGTEVASKTITLVNVASSYSFGTTSAFGEGSSGSVQFNYSFAANKSVAFSVVAPTSGLSGVSDVTLNTTSFAIGATNAAGNVSVTYSAAADTTTEGAEYFRIAATVDGSTYYSGDITISDTSLSAPTYSFTRSVASIGEGGTFTVTFNTNQAGSFGYTITGIESADIGGAGLTGNVSNGSILSFSVTEDTSTEGTQYFNIALNNGLASTSVTFNDTSLTPSYSFTRSVTSVNEPGSFSITFNTNQTGNFGYTITGIESADIGGAGLTGLVTNGSVLSYSVTADSVTEGTQYFNIALNNGQASTTVTFNDTSLTPATYSLTTSVANVNEPGSFSVTFSTNQAGSFGYTITGIESADIGGASLTGTVSNGSVLNYSVTADSATEGTQYFTISLNNGQASTSVTFNDTSLTPATYSLTPSVSSINEGGSFSVTFSTNQAGSFSYTISGIEAADIAGASLTGTVSNGSVLSYSVTADSSTEGTQYFSIALNNGQASASVTFNDTSRSPPSYFLGNTWSGTVNNGVGLNFYLNSTNANGVAVSVYATGTGAGRVSISPANFTINTDASTQNWIGITTSFPTSTVAAQSVTINVSTGQSFSFTIAGYTVAGPAPTITSVVMTSGEYYPGETVDAVINFSGPITSDTYVNTKLTAGAYGSFYITSTTGAVGPPGGNGTGGENLQLIIGTNSAYYTGPANPGQLNVLNATLSARTMTGTATGSQRQAYVTTPTFKVYT